MESNEYKEKFCYIYENDGFFTYGGESRSGAGSTLEITEKIRKDIVKLIKEKDIKSIVDLGCGDFNWMKEIGISF